MEARVRDLEQRKESVQLREKRKKEKGKGERKRPKAKLTNRES